MNRAIQGLTLFEQPGDYDRWLGILASSVRDHRIALFTYSVMPNHFHLVVRASLGLELSSFMQTLTMTHAQQWRAETKTAGRGAVYQGRFRAVPVQEDGHFLRVCLYVERNPVRAALVRRADEWRWSSAWDFVHEQDERRPALAPWPVTRPADWSALLARAGLPSIDARIRRSVRQGIPYGSIDWQEGQLPAALRRSATLE
jgi:putative transposase